MAKKEKIIIANWKMKLSLKETLELAKAVNTKFDQGLKGTVVVCPNFLSLIESGKIIKDSPVKLGAQDVFWDTYGAFTGEVSANMLKDAGCDYIIIGHSERRQYLMENYEMIHKEIKAVLDVEGLTPVVCIGENWEERKTDRRDFVLFDQIQQALNGIQISGDREIIVAYEPIWAIGSGTAIEPSEAEYAHKIIKLTLDDMFGQEVVDKNFRIIYGGSINSVNVKGFVGLDNLDGMLVGGAGLNANEFHKVVKSVLK